jgi:hypothetical protein
MVSRDGSASASCIVIPLVMHIQSRFSRNNFGFTSCSSGKKIRPLRRAGKCCFAGGEYKTTRAGILGHLWGPLTTPHFQDVGVAIGCIGKKHPPFLRLDPTSEVDSYVESTSFKKSGFSSQQLLKSSMIINK